jgi:DnaJ like chaperone protein
MAKFGKWIGGGLGWAVGGPIGGILGFVIGSVFDGSTEALSTTRTGYSGQTTAGGYIMSLLVLTSAVMKADGKVLRSELDYVKRFLVHNFGESSATEGIRLLKDLLEQTIPVDAVSNQIKQNMNYSARLQLLHYLYGIAQADGAIDANEKELISAIAREMGISMQDFESIQAMFVPNTDGDYKILEVERSSSNDDIKKAYRRMAMKYHPDKVSHLGEDFQVAAHEKFQSVNKAYENIKKERGIV